MIYTSYFAKLNKLPDNIIPIAISRMQPKGINIPKIDALMPPEQILWNYKRDGNIQKYTRDYLAEVLDNLNVIDIVNYLYALSNGKDVALICYESPEKFCHRHIVADWLSENGITCVEWRDNYK